MAAFRRLRGTRETSLFSALPGDAPAAGSDEFVTGDEAFRLVRGWLARERADALFDGILRTTHWIQERRTMYDREVAVPREQAWFGEGCVSDFTPALDAVRRELETFAGARFAFVLINRYRDGNDSVAWHYDRAVAGLARPIVASLTLGATRAFDVRAKDVRSRIISVDLDHGDLIVMASGAQAHYEHRVPKDRRIGGERINLTFRQVS